MPILRTNGYAFSTVRPAAIFLALSLLCGCKRAPTPAPSASQPPLPPHAVEVFTGGANADAPLVLAIHGMGDWPPGFAEFVKQFSGRAHFVIPQAPTPRHNGYSWFEFLPNMSDADFGRAIGTAEDELWKVISPTLADRRLIVMGFSQGGILSFAIAARHPERVVCALPISGSLPQALMPAKGHHAAPTYAFHGSADPVIDVKYARQGVATFKELGGVSELREYPGTPHTVSREMQRDVFQRLEQCLAMP